ncbi:MAG: helix-turn-helix domain-containing protein [Betaproteobacteria bacterium]|nr:helix-turn-helix domain-containing protein [Betaproteobacteria bacterium]
MRSRRAPTASALQSAIIAAGSQSALVRKINARAGRKVISQQAVSLWLAQGAGPTAELVLDIAAVIGFKVTPHELRPDIYPYPGDALPPRFKKAA